MPSSDRRRRLMSVAAVLLLTAAGPFLAGWSWPFGRPPAPADDAARRQAVERLYADYRREFPEVPDIAPADSLDLWRRGSAVLVDERAPEEQAVSMIPGALRADDLQTRWEDFRGKTVIVYCTIGYRSGKLAQELRARGVAAVNIRGGLLGWVHAGGPVADAGGPVKRIHVYGKTWDLAPADFEAVY